MLGAFIKESFTPAAGNGGDLNIALTSVTGFVRFSEWFADDCPVWYSIVKASDGTPLEIGKGIYQSSNSLDRTLPMATYVSGTLDRTAPSRVTLTDGTAYHVICTPDADTLLPAHYLPFQDLSSNHKNVIPGNLLSFAGSTVTAQAANRLYAWPFMVPLRAEYDAFICRTGTLAGSPITDFALYAHGLSDGRPGKRIAYSENQVLTGGAVNVAAFTGGAVVIDPGWYWMAMAQSSTSNQMISVVLAPGPVGIGHVASPDLRSLYVAHTAGNVPPTPMGATNQQPYSTTNIFPGIGLRVT